MGAVQTARQCQAYDNGLSYVARYLGPMMSGDGGVGVEVGMRISKTWSA